MFAKDVDPAKLIRPTATDRLDLLPADASLRGLDRFLFGLGKKKRLLKLIEDVGRDYDRILLDAPPGLTETSEQVLRAADLIIVPVIPSPLSRRALDEVVAHLDRHALRRRADPAGLSRWSTAAARCTARRSRRSPMAGHPDGQRLRGDERRAGRRPAGCRPPRPPPRPCSRSWTGIEKRLTRKASD